MSVVNNENIDLAAWYVNHQHSRCCCKPSYPDDRCNHCKPTFQICCLMATVGTNARKHYLARYSGPDATAWQAGDPCDYLGSHNLCGSLRTLINDGTECMSSMVVDWTVSQDCETVRVTCNGTYRDLPRDWYNSPQTFVNPSTGDPDVTLSNCPVPTIVLPIVGATGIDLVGELWWLGPNPGDPDVRSEYRTRATGNDICGSNVTCPGEGLNWFWYCNRLSWRMLDDLETMEFRIEFGGVSGGIGGSLCSSAPTLIYHKPWGTGLNGTGTGDWYEDANLPIIIPVSGGYWKIGKVVGCGTEIGCVEVDCYPLCVVNECPPGTFNAISPALTFDGVQVGTFHYSFEDGWSFLPDEDYPDWFAQLFCTTPGTPEDGQTLLISPPIEWDGPTEFAITMTCTGGSMDDIIIEVPVPPETVVITLTA